MSELDFSIPVQRVQSGCLQGHCPWCDHLTPEYLYLRQVHNSVRKHIRNEHEHE